MQKSVAEVIWITLPDPPIGNPGCLLEAATSEAKTRDLTLDAMDDIVYVHFDIG